MPGCPGHACRSSHLRVGGDSPISCCVRWSRHIPSLTCRSSRFRSSVFFTTQEWSGSSLLSRVGRAERTSRSCLGSLPFGVPLTSTQISLWSVGGAVTGWRPVPGVWFACLSEACSSGVPPICQQVWLGDGESVPLLSVAGTLECLFLSSSEVSRLSSPFQGESRPERSRRGEGFEGGNYQQLFLPSLIIIGRISMQCQSPMIENPVKSRRSHIQ